MTTEAVRQRYALATGGKLQGSDTSAKTTPKYAKGGKVKGKFPIPGMKPKNS